MRKLSLSLLLLFLVGTLIGCAKPETKSPDVTGGIRTSLDQADLKDVSVKQDRDKGVVTLSGNVASESDKMRAEAIAKSMAGAQVVANQVAVLPPAGEKDAKDVNSSLDKGIENNLDAALTLNKLHDDVKYDVKNGVVTLKGEVNSQARREEAEKVAAIVPNVQQVVNELEVKGQKATSTR